MVWLIEKKKPLNIIHTLNNEIHIYNSYYFTRSIYVAIT